VRKVDPECELCAADRVTDWFHEDDQCWVAECEACGTPMVVWKTHATDPPTDVREVLHGHLRQVTAAEFDYEPWIDENMRSIPTHYHAHARPRVGFYGHGRRRRAGPDLSDE